MSQLNFFLTKDEMNEKLKHLMDSKQVQIFKGIFFDTRTPVPVSYIDQLKEFDRLTIWITNQYCEARCSEKGSGAFKNKFLFDSYKDPVIELQNCSITNSLISPGRIYFKAGWIEKSELRQLHKKAAAKIRRHMNKNLSKLSPPFKISDGIKKLLLEGYELELGSGGKRVSQKDIFGI